MRILVVGQHFYPEQFKVNDICKSLVKMGHNVTVLTGLPNYPEGKVLKEYKWFKRRKEVIDGINVIRVPLIGRGNNNFRIAINYVSFAINSCLKAIFMKKNFDVIYCFQTSPISMVWAGIIVKKMKNIPLAIHSLDLWPASMMIGGVKENSWQYKFFYNMSKKTYEYADKILISSKEYKDYFINTLNIKDKGYEYIPNFADDIYKNVKSIDNKMFDLLFAGNIGPAQNVESIVLLAELLKARNDILIHVVGDGLSKDKCEKLANEKQLKNIKFYGKYQSKDMKKFYELADAFLITLEDNETVNKCEPFKLVTYMCAGKPIFGMVNGAVQNIVNSTNSGIIVNVNEIEKLADIIKDYSNKKEELNKFANNSKEYYNKFYDKNIVMKNLEKTLLQMVERKSDIDEKNN